MVPATLRGHRGNQAPSPRPSCRDRAHRRVVAPSLSGPPPLRLHLHRRRVVSVGRVAGPPGPGVTLHDVPSAPPRVHRRLRGRRLGGRRRHRSSPPLAGLGSGRLCGSSTRRPPPGGPTPGGAGSVTDPWRNRIIGSGTETPDDLLANPATLSDTIPAWIRSTSGTALDRKCAPRPSATGSTTPEDCVVRTTGARTTPVSSSPWSTSRGRIASPASTRCSRMAVGTGSGHSIRLATAPSTLGAGGSLIGTAGSWSTVRFLKVSTLTTPATIETSIASEGTPACTAAVSIRTISTRSPGERTSPAPLAPPGIAHRLSTASTAIHCPATTSWSLVVVDAAGSAIAGGVPSSRLDDERRS